MRRFPGVLLRAPASEFGDSVFYVAYGRRHWVRDAAWLSTHGFAWPDDVFDVDAQALYRLAPSSGMPLFGDGDFPPETANSSMDMREVAAGPLRGVGVEFGAGASPYPVPPKCRTLYADPYSYETLCENRYPGQTVAQIVRPDFVTDLQSLHGIPDDSLDFIVACHVIEHTSSPITAIRACHRALRQGGSLLLVVPDMTKTFDRDRERTLLQHLIDDDVAPSAERDLEHFVEFYERAIPPATPVEDPRGYARARQSARADIHYHCWDYSAFEELVEWTRVHAVPWSEVWSHPTLPGADNIEFYFRLTK